ncbi:MAG: response regulator [Pirellulales bacterium]|nr:response regulator [Pirellulales bacterium]
MGQKTVLLAEDDPAHAVLIRRALEQVPSKCHLEVVRDGRGVIDYLFATGSHAGRDPADAPHLILLDLKMPAMDGLQLLQVLRRVRSGEPPSLPPVVILTSSAEQPEVADAYRLGAHSFIQKPMEFAELVEVMRRIVTYWLDLNCPPPGRCVGPPPDTVRTSQ